MSVSSLVERVANRISAALFLWRVHRISKRLSNAVYRPLLDTQAHLEDLADGRPDPAQRAREDLFDLCMKRETLRVVMEEYDADRDDLRELHRWLNSAGLGQWVNHQYGSAICIAMPESLDYLLMKREEDELPGENSIAIAANLLTCLEKGWDHLPEKGRVTQRLGL